MLQFVNVVDTWIENAVFVLDINLNWKFPLTIAALVKTGAIGGGTTNA